MNEPTQKKLIRLILLDELNLFRASLGRFLASQPGLEVAGECGTAAEALSILKSSAVDLVLLDFDLGAESGNGFISAARQSGYQGHFLIVAGSLDLPKSAIVLKLGVAGIFLKSEALDRLLQAIKLVASGQVWVDQKVIQTLANQSMDRRYQLERQRWSKSLDQREQKVLLLIMEGLSNRKIGAEIGLSEGSVKHIVRRVFGKLGVKTRSQLVRAALEPPLAATHSPNGTAIK